MREENRGPWYLLTGLVLGLAAGLAFAWVVSPVRYVDTAPASLRDDFKSQYRALIAVAYLYSGDLQRAQVRLNTLGQANPAGELALQAQDALAEGRPESEVQALTLLSAALSGQAAPVDLTGTPSGSPAANQTPQPALNLTPTPLVVQATTAVVEASAPTPTSGATRARGTATFTPTPIPSRTPTLTPGADFVLQNQQLVCDLTRGEALIQVEVLDAAGQPVPGVEIVVRWEGGEDHFFTGLHPQISLGYADFAMTPGVSYQVQLASGGQTVPDLVVSECEGDPGRYWGNWLLEFVQP